MAPGTSRVSVEPPKPQGTPSPPFIATAPALEALALLDRGLGARAPFVVVTGEPGVGKSTLVREALRRWGARVHARRLSPGEATAETLFATLLGRLGGTTNSQANGPAIAQRLVEAIAHAASAGKVVMVVMEDAHLAAPELLLQLANVAEMAHRKPCAFEVMLVGTPELSARLAEPALSSLTDKLAAPVKLSQLTQHDTRHYLLQRSGATGASASGMFSRKACRDIHGATFGVPRAIEALADESARRAAKAGATTISPEHVRSATQALRARRSNASASASMPRPERVNAAPTEDAAARERASEATTKPANAAPPKPVNGRPVGTNGTPRGTETAKREAPDAARPAQAAATPAPGAPAETATTSGDTKLPKASEQRVKDWVSRFGGSTGVRIGASHSIPRYEASATLDVPAPSPARPTAPAKEGAAPAADGGATPAKARKLIVDEEPPFPPELVARLNKLTTKRRRRGPGTTIQGAALALAVALLVVVLARQAGFGKHLGIDSADTGARQVSAVTPAPPLALGAGDEPRRPASHRATSPSAGTTVQHKRPKLILTPTEPEKPEPSREPKPAPKKPVATTHAQSPALPAPPHPSTTSAPAITSAPTTGPTDADPSPINPHQKFAIVAGSFQSNDMAKAEKDHLARLVQYRVWVNKSKVEGKRTYQLMVGRFDSMEHAWDAGQSLMRRGLIRDANVQPLSE
jgi:type II secretory pathway predicted ATPase ExeA